MKEIKFRFKLFKRNLLFLIFFKNDIFLFTEHIFILMIFLFPVFRIIFILSSGLFVKKRNDFFFITFLGFFIYLSLKTKLLFFFFKKFEVIFHGFSAFFFSCLSAFFFITLCLIEIITSNGSKSHSRKHTPYNGCKHVILILTDSE